MLYKATVISLLTLSLVATVGRVAIRLRHHKRLFIDDVFLFIAVACLCVAIGLMLHSSSSLYLVEAVQTGSPSIELPPDWLEQSQLYRRYNAAWEALIWTNLFAVKFSFLFFFKKLTHRVHQMTTYWWVITIGTGILWVYATSYNFITCPYFDLRMG